MTAGLEAFETERLVAERIGPQHLAELCAMHRDRRVMATLTVDGEPLDEEETARRLERYADDWRRHGFGMWVFCDRQGKYVGRGGLRRCQVAGRDEVELAYALMFDAWGQGLASEMAEASLRIGFEPLRLPDVVAFTLVTNLRSQRVMQRAGFQFEREFDHVGLPHVLYRLTAEAWRARPPATGG